MSCISKLFDKSPEIHSYLRDKAGIDYNEATGEGKDEWIKAAKDLQDNSRNSLNDIYTSLKVPGFEPKAKNTSIGLSHGDWLDRNKDQFSEADYNRINEGLTSTDAEVKQKAIDEIVAKKEEIKNTPESNISENVKNKFQSFKNKKNGSTQSSEQQQESNKQSGVTEHARTEQAGGKKQTTGTEGSDSNIGSKKKEEVSQPVQDMNTRLAAIRKQIKEVNDESDRAVGIAHDRAVDLLKKLKGQETVLENHIEEVKQQPPEQKPITNKEVPNKTTWESNIEALVHPETGLGAVTKRILEEQQPLKDAFLKRIGLTIEDYRKLDENGKQKVQEQWVKSKEFNELGKRTEEPTTNKEVPIVQTPKPSVEEKSFAAKDLARADAKKVYASLNEMDNPTDARGVALDYLAKGGKVSRESINKEVVTKRDERITPTQKGGNREVANRDYVDNEADGIKTAADKLWQSLPAHLQDGISSQDIRNELVDVIKSHDKRLNIAKEYIDSYHPEVAQARFISDNNDMLAHFEKMHQEEFANIEKGMKDYNAEELANDKVIAESDEYINHLIKQYENETTNSAANNEVTKGSESKGNAQVGIGETNVSNEGKGTKPTNDKSAAIENTPDYFQAQTPDEEDVAQIKEIVNDLINEGTTSLKKIQDIAAKELGDTPEVRKLVEDAYNSATKEVKIADTNEKGQPIKNELTTSFAKRINNFIDHIFGKSKGENTVVLKDSKAVMDKANELGASTFQGLTNEQKEVKNQLDEASNEYQTAKKSFDKKRSELDKKISEDQKDLFGNRPAENKKTDQQKLFDERVSTSARDKALEPFKARLTKAEDSVNKLQKKFNEMGGSTGQISMFQDAKGEVLGFTHNGKIYLNGEKLNPNTAAHEAGHIWTEWAKTNATDIYNRGIDLINKSDYLKKVQNNKFYQEEAAKLPEADREAYFQHEALAAAIGDKGAQFVTEAKRNSFIEWAKNLWDSVAKAVGFKDVTADELQNMTLDEFSKRAAADILKGEPQKGEQPIPKAEKVDTWNESEFASVRREKLEEIKGAQKIFENRQKIPWNETYQKGLEHLQEMYPKKSLYEAMKARVEHFADMLDRKKIFNPTSEDNAVFNVFRSETEKRISNIDGLDSPDPEERRRALLESEPLENDLQNIARVTNPEGEAGRAFNILQSLVKSDPNNGLKIMRMQILRAKGGEELTPDEKAWTEQKWNELKESYKQEQELKSKAMQDDFEKKISDLQRQFKEKGVPENKGAKLTIEKRKSFADSIRKAADKLENFGRAKGTEGAVTSGIDIQKNIADAMRYVADKLEEGKFELPDIILSAIEKFGKDNRDEFKNKIKEELASAGVGKDLLASKKEAALENIKKYAEENKLTDVTKEMVGKNLISDYVNSHIGEVDQKDLLNTAAKDLKEVLPDINKKKLIEAYLKEGDYKQETKKDLEGGLAENKKQLVSIAKLEEDITDLNDLKDVRQRSFPTEREKSDYEQKLFEEKKSKLDALREERNKVAKTERDAQKRADKLAELDANIRRAENGQDIIKTYRKNPERNIDADILDKQRQLKKLINDNSPDEKVQDKLLANAKKTAIRNTAEFKRRLAAGEYEEPQYRSRTKTDAELIRLNKEQSLVEAEFRKKQQEIREANKSGFEKFADFARSLYVAALIGSLKTLAKVGSLAGLRPLSETLTKVTLGKLYNQFFPGIARAARRGGEGSDWRDIQQGLKAYFYQKGEKGVEAMSAKSEAAYQRANRDYENFKAEYDKIKEQNPKAKLPEMEAKLKTLETERKERLLGTMGNLVYQFIGGSSTKDMMKALINRSNEIERQFGRIGEEEVPQPNVSSAGGFFGAELQHITYALGFVGRSHAALKTFSARFSFAAGFMARLESAVDDNIPLDSDKILEIAHESYLDWERGKYQQDNAITTLWNRILSNLDNSKEHPQTGKVAAALLRFDVAITRVPVNILHEAVVEYTFGAVKAAILGSKAVRKATAELAEKGILKNSEGFKDALREQVSNMDGNEAAAIVRAFRKGGIGIGLYVLAAISGGVHFGIFPHLGQKKKKDESLLGKDELNPGQVMIGDNKFGEIMSAVVEHIPALWPTFMGLGMAQAYHDQIKKGKTTAQAVASSAYTHFKILESGIPQTKLIQGLQEDVVNTMKKKAEDSGIIDKSLPNGYKTEDAKDPNFKYVLDKGGTLPAFNPTTIEIPSTDKEGNPVMKKLQEMPEKDVEEFNSQRKENLKSSINDLINGQNVYLDDYGRAGITYSKEHNNPVTLDELTAEQRKEVWSLLGSKATKETKASLYSQ